MSLMLSSNVSNLTEAVVFTDNASKRVKAGLRSRVWMSSPSDSVSSKIPDNFQQSWSSIRVLGDSQPKVTFCMFEELTALLFMRKMMMHVVYICIPRINNPAMCIPHSVGFPPFQFSPKNTMLLSHISPPSHSTQIYNKNAVYIQIVYL